MESVAGDNSSTVAPLAKWRSDFARVFQYYLDRSTPHHVQRWLGTLAVSAIYMLRVYYVQGFYVVSYGLGIYVLNLLIGFLSPKVDPELEVLDGASLPTKGSDEFKPFVRRLPEFKFWYSITKAFCVAFLMTFFTVFDVPVFWPILLFYWVVLFVLTMKRQIMHMIKFKYVPFSIGKQSFAAIFIPMSANKMTMIVRGGQSIYASLYFVNIYGISSWQPFTFFILIGTRGSILPQAAAEEGTIEGSFKFF